MGHVYIAVNECLRHDIVKIGFTEQNDPSLRAEQLHGAAGLPTPFRIYFSIRTDDPKRVEQELHFALDGLRIHPRREFFTITPEQVKTLLKYMGQESTPSAATQNSEVEADEIAAEETLARRRPRFNFREMGIEPNSELIASKGGKVARVVDERRVAMDGEEMSLTEATRRVHALDGYHYAPMPRWSFNGRSLQEIYDQTYPAE